MKRFLHIAVFALLAASCEIPFDLDQEGKPLIYVQAVAQNDSVTITPRYAAPVNGGAPQTLNNLDIRLLVNGQAAGLERLEGGRYRCKGSFEEGDRFDLSLKADGLEEVGGSTVLPHRPVVTDFAWKNVQVDTIHAVEVRMTLDRAPVEGEYYGIQISCETAVTYADGSDDAFTLPVTPGYVLSAADSGNMDLEDFMQVNYADGQLGGKAFAPITLLTQKQFDGTLYKFYLDSFDSNILDRLRQALPKELDNGSGLGGLDPNKIPVAINTIYTFTLSRLSTEFFLYGKAMYQSNFDFLSNMGLTPANFTYTNVSGGMGMVGALSSATVGPVEIKKDWSYLLP